MKHVALISIGFLFFSVAALAEEQLSPQHLADVQRHRQQLVPYAADQALETFSKTVHGGVMHVISKTADDVKQIKLIQDHLLKMTEDFSKGDFSGTEQMHGMDMPGLQQLKTAKTDDIRYEYKALPNGAQIHFSTEYPQYVQALHEWMDAQMKDHGNAEVPEHMKHHKAISE